MQRNDDVHQQCKSQEFSFQKADGSVIKIELATALTLNAKFSFLIKVRKKHIVIFKNGHVVHVEDISQGMTSVGKQIGPVCVPRCTIEVIVLLDQPLQLRLHVRQLFHRKLVLIQCNFRRFQISQKPSLLRSKEEQSTACALISSSCAANLFREKG